jgi:predicted dehydrogenase
MSKSTVSSIAIVGLGKMGISHLAIANANRRLKVVAVCDSSALLGQMVERHCGLPYLSSYDDVIALPGLDAVLIATPTRYHDKMVRDALARGLHVFCEKPLTLSSVVSRELADEARRLGRVCQVGYHNRFVGTFREVKRLIDSGVIGRVRHVQAEAYGPVVLRPTAKTWRSQAELGGGCLYDYAAHPINLANWYVGAPLECSGADLTSQYSVGVDDAVHANLHFANGILGQVSVNWSDETIRKMTTKVTVFGDGGKITADRQEIQVFVGKTGNPIEHYGRGWSVRYITELTPNVDYYLRGEEYSAQIDAFADAVAEGTVDCVNDFASAADTDLTLELIRARAAVERVPTGGVAPVRPRDRSLLSRVFGR